MSEHRTGASSVGKIIAATVFILTLTAGPVGAVEATGTGPGPGIQGVPPAAVGKGEGPWAKAGSILRQVFAAHTAHQQAGTGQAFKPANPSVQIANGLILVDAIAASDGAALLAELRGLGLRDGTQYGAVVSGRLPLGQLNRVVELANLRGITASLKPETNSAIDPTFGLVHDRRGAIAMNVIAGEADPQSFTGTGIKVGVLSDTFDNNGNPDYDGDGVGEPPATNAADDFANGDLPDGTVPFVALHTPGDVDDDDKSAFGANGTSGANATASDPTHPNNLAANLRFAPTTFDEPLAATITYNDAPHLEIGASPFTIELWVRAESFDPNGRWAALASKYSNPEAQRGFILWISGPNDPVPNSLSWLATPDNEAASIVRMDRPWVPVPGQWYHVAISRDQQMNMRMFVDGTQLGAAEYFPIPVYDTTTDMRISGFDNPGLPRPLDGWVEDFRMVVGEALYTENFTPPTAPLDSALPPPPAPVAGTNIVDDTADPGIDEGRAMMQLIHDVAPDASLSFHTAFNGMADFAQGIQDLADDGADVIVDDIIYFAEPMFQDGIVAQAVDNVVAQGKAYFSSAGNAAQNSYESPFVASGERLTVNGIFGPEERGMLHDFDPGPGVDYMQSVTIPANTTFTAVLQWDQPFASNCPGCPGSENDADIYLVDDSLQIIASSISDNLASGEPVEILQLQNVGGLFGTNLHLMITHYDVVTPQHPQPGPPPTLMKYVWFGQSSISVNEFKTNSPASYGHANAAGAAAVGAAYYLDTPAFGVSPPQLESFSAQGGVPILFDVSGNPIAVPGPREKPEFVAPDGTNTTFFFRDTSTDDADEAPEAFPNFFGTSAAAPHAAAIAALMLEANPALTPGDIYSILETTAIDMGPAGFDFDTGYGLIDATAAIAQATGGNLVPLAENDAAGTDQNTLVSIPVLANDALGDQPTAITLVTDPPNGSAAINGASIDYTPDTGYFGPDSFDYTIQDNDGETSSATVNVTVNEVNTPANAVNDNAVTDEDVAASAIDVMANDDIGNAPTTIISAGPNSTEGGSVTTDGATVSYTPPADYFGPDSFPYTIEDSDGDQSTAMVNMTVNPVNDPPVAESELQVWDEDMPFVFTDAYMLANDTDVDEGDVVSIFVVESTSFQGGDINDNGDGSYTYTPPLNFNGDDAINYTITDGNGGIDVAAIALTINPVNDPPVAANDNGGTTNQNTPLTTTNVLTNDTDVDGDILSVQSFDATSANGGSIASNGDGTFDYTPAPGFSGTDTFDYIASDGNGGSDGATVDVTVNAAATTVHIGDLDGSSAAAPRNRWDATVTVIVHDASDTPISGALVDGSWSGGANGGGSCTTNNGGQCSISKNNLKANVDSVAFTVNNVTSAAGTYNAADNHDPDLDSNGTSITVLQSGGTGNLLPNAVDDSATTSVGVPVNDNVLANDDQGDAPATVTNFDTVSALGGSVSMAANGDYTYTPPADVSGVVDTFGYTITDSNGDTSSATVSVTINPVTTQVEAHIADLDGASASAPRNRWVATVTVTVHDAFEAPVQGAFVEGSWSNGANGAGSCTTNTSGRCDIPKSNIKGNVGSVTFIVGSVSGTGIDTYDPGANHDPDGDSDGTVIIVAQ